MKNENIFFENHFNHFQTFKGDLLLWRHLTAYFFPIKLYNYGCAIVSIKAPNGSTSDRIPQPQKASTSQPHECEAEVTYNKGRQAVVRMLGKFLAFPFPFPRTS